MWPGCRGKWVTAKDPCTHSDQWIDGPNPPSFVAARGATSGGSWEQRRHFTPTGHPSSYQGVHARAPTGQPNGSIVTFKIAPAA